MPNAMDCSTTPMFALELDRNGRLSKKTMKLGREAQLTNTLLEGLYPGIRVATVDVPTEPLDSCEQAMVEQALTRIEFDGIRYSLVGASGSAKKGKFYAVEVPSIEKKTGGEVSVLAAGRHDLLRDSGVLVQGYHRGAGLPIVMVVDDHQFGTNDCRGWISQSLFRRLQAKHQSATFWPDEMERLLAQRIGNSLRMSSEDFNLTEEEETALVEQARSQDSTRRYRRRHRFYQFRLAFDKTQAKGAFKVMADEVAENLDADIILPRSCVKPKYQGGVVADDSVDSGRSPGPLFPRTVSWSAFVTSPAISNSIRATPCWSTRRKSSIELEIKPYALSQIEKAAEGVRGKQLRGAVRVAGHTGKLRRVLELGEEPDPDYTTNEYTVAQAALLPTATGYMLKHPFIQHHLQKVLVNGRIASAPVVVFVCRVSRWRTTATLCFTTDKWSVVRTGFRKTGPSPLFHRRHGLVVRYPIRMKEDLLPVENLSVDEYRRPVGRASRTAGCRAGGRPGCRCRCIEQLQLRVRWSCIRKPQHRNGGDFDFDMCAWSRTTVFRGSSKTGSPTRNNTPPQEQNSETAESLVEPSASCDAGARKSDRRHYRPEDFVPGQRKARPGAGVGGPASECAGPTEAWNPARPGSHSQHPQRSTESALAEAETEKPIEDMDEHLTVDERDKVGRLYNFRARSLGGSSGTAATAPLERFPGSDRRCRALPRKSLKSASWSTGITGAGDSRS